MATQTPTLLNRLFSAVAITLLLVGAPLLAAPPVVHDAVAPASETLPPTPSHILPTRYEFPIRTDDGMPLAREDVVPLHTALTDNRTPQQGQPATRPADDPNLKILSRATDAKMREFQSRTSMQQLSSLFLEISQMVDARHVNPPSYESRTRGGVEDLIRALQSDVFLRANGVSPNPQAISSVQNQLWQLAQNQPARNASDIVGIMQYAADVANRGLGVRREAAALEFMNGTIDALDKYSAFMPETSGSGASGQASLIRTAGLEENIVGIGVELKAHAQGAEVVDVIENGPAAQLGLQGGDIIVAVNQKEMAGRTLNEVADLIGGRSGTSVTLDVLRDGRRLRGTLTRRQVYVSSVTGTKMIDTQRKTGYIRLKQFSESSKEDLEKALWTLHNQGMQSLVLDLRQNPGGLLDECVDICNLFLPRGTIVSTRGRNNSDNTQEVATFAKTWNVPLVVLVDENSASASEILAAAIQDNQRGVVIGRNSYGKGTVQTHFPLRTVSATLKLTTAMFYSPSGREMAGQGVTPDVPVNVATDGRVRGTMNDADLQAALQIIQQGQPAALAAQAPGGRVGPMPSQNGRPVFNLPDPQAMMNLRQY